MCFHILKNRLAKDAASLCHQGPDSGSLPMSSLSILQIGLKEKICWEKKGRKQKSLWFLSLISRQIIALKNGPPAFRPPSD